MVVSSHSVVAVGSQAGAYNLKSAIPVLKRERYKHTLNKDDGAGWGVGRDGERERERELFVCLVS